MGDQPPQQPVTLSDAAIMLHELYLTYQQAGFAPAEALYLVGQVATASLRPPPPGT